MNRQPQRTVLVCVTPQASSERLVTAGKALAEKAGCALNVVSVLPVEFGGDPKVPQALEQIYRFAKQAGGELAIYFNDDPALTVAAHAAACKPLMLVVVMGAMLFYLQIVQHSFYESRALALAGSVVWFDFATLCGGPRSQNDYLELANRFHAVILSGVPRMGPRQASEARRFTWLIDVFYDHRVKLIMSAECEPEEIYTEGALANEFHRTVSRILEMQSREYLESERRLTATL